MSSRECAHRPTAASPEKDFELRIPDAQRLDLAQGFRVVLAPDPSLPVFAVHLRIAGGSGLDPTGRSGLTHLCEHLLYAGCDAESQEGILRRLRSHGGTASAYTSLDAVVFEEILPSAAVGLGLETCLRRLKGDLQGLSSSRVEGERRILARERDEVASSGLEATAFERLHLHLYRRDDPYHRSPMGKEEDLLDLPLEEVEHHVEDVLRTQPTVLLVAGGFDPATMASRLGELLPDLVPRRPRSPHPVFSCQEGRLWREESSGPPPVVFAGWRTTGTCAEGGHLPELLRQVLTGGDRYQPRTAELRARAQTAQIHLLSMERASTFVLEAKAAEGTEPRDLEAAVVAEASFWSEGRLPPSDVAAARLRRLRRWAGTIDDLRSAAEWMAAREMRALEGQDLPDLPEAQGDGATAEDLAAFARRWIDPAAGVMLSYSSEGLDP